MNKTMFRSIGAILGGFVFIVVTHTGTDAILEAAGVLPTGNLFVGTGFILVVLGYRAVFSFIGCYLTQDLLHTGRSSMHSSLERSVWC